jgi:Tfp pilus assembly protein FimT
MKRPLQNPPWPPFEKGGNSEVPLLIDPSTLNGEDQVCPLPPRDGKSVVEQPLDGEFHPTKQRLATISKTRIFLNNIKMKRSNGFTLFDVLAVVLILGIVALLGLPSINAALEDHRLSGAVDEIVTALEYARARAINTGSETRVTIDDTADTILVEQFIITGNLLGSDTTLPEADVEGGSYTVMELPMNRGTDYSISFSDDERFDGVDITSTSFGAGNFVIFGALGTPTDGGTVTLSSNNRQAVISVDSLTGRVTANSE